MITGYSNTISVTTSAPSLLLDLYPSAAAAYSVRKLRTAYTGNAIRVRRSSDNAEQNIGFTALGNLDTSALTSFCGSGNGFVTTWYDQSGNANNATQTTASNQPKVVSSGSVILENGKPSVEFDNTNNFMNTSSFPSLSNASYFIVSKLNIGTGIGDFSYIFSTAGSSAPIQSLAKRENTGSDANKRYVYDGTSVNTDGVNSLNQELASLFFPTSSPYLNLYINNSSQTFNSTPSTSLSPLNKYITIGRFDGGTTHYMDGKAQEFIVYASDESSNRTGIQTNINSYYAIY
jgi:hypothetical protein